MKENSDGHPQEMFDASPYLKLIIDKDGHWFQNGAEIIHREIYKQFNQMLERTGDGGYQVRLGKEICRVEVEDAPFVIQRVSEEAGGILLMELNDGSSEKFNPREFWIGQENVPYSRVKDGHFHARFSRPAYYQLARHIQSDEECRRFFVEIDGERTPIKVDTANSDGA